MGAKVQKKRCAKCRHFGHEVPTLCNQSAYGLQAKCLWFAGKAFVDG